MPSFALIAGCFLCVGIAVSCVPDHQPASSPTSPASRPSPGGASTAAWHTEGALRIVDFDRSPLGGYTAAQIAIDWGGKTPWQDGIAEGRVSVAENDHGGHFLRVGYPANGVGPKAGGSEFLVSLGRSYDDLYCAYRVRFAHDFDFMRGGKLPGLVGGAHNTGGHKPNGADGWSARLMWRPAGEIVQYVYHPDQKGEYGDDFQWGQHFVPGQWHVVEHRVRMNTPGRADGFVQAWLDGKPVLDHQGLRFRDAATFAIDALYFSTFFGGNDPSWGPPKDEVVDFDDFVVSERPITH